MEPLFFMARVRASSDVYGIAEMIVKVKEPIASEYPLVRKGQLVFTYFHFASDEALTLATLRFLKETSAFLYGHASGHLTHRNQKG